MQAISAQIAPVLEAALFSAGHPLKLETLLALFPSEEVTKDVVKEALSLLTTHYADRGVVLKEVASGWRFEVNPEQARALDTLFEEKPGRYSRALLETLALIAYRQPITRAEIEEIRGVVVSTQIIRTLTDHNWIRVIGHRDVPGKPALYATTKEFLDVLSLKSLSDLPPLSAIHPIETIANVPDSPFVEHVPEVAVVAGAEEASNSSEEVIEATTEEVVDNAEEKLQFLEDSQEELAENEAMSDEDDIEDEGIEVITVAKEIVAEDDTITDDIDDVPALEDADIETLSEAEEPAPAVPKESFSRDEFTEIVMISVDNDDLPEAADNAKS